MEVFPTPPGQCGSTARRQRCTKAALGWQPTCQVSDSGVVSFYATAYPAGQQPGPGSGGNGVNPPGTNTVECVYDGERDARLRTTWTEDHYELDHDSSPREINNWTWKQDVGGTGDWWNLDFGQIVSFTWPADREPFTQAGTAHFQTWGTTYPCGGPRWSTSTPRSSSATIGRLVKPTSASISAEATAGCSW